MRCISDTLPKEKSLRSITSMAPGFCFQTSSGQSAYQESIRASFSTVMERA